MPASLAAPSSDTVNVCLNMNVSLLRVAVAAKAEVAQRIANVLAVILFYRANYVRVVAYH